MTASFYRRLPDLNVGLLPLARDWWPCRLCFTSRAIDAHAVCMRHQCQGQFLGSPGLVSAVGDVHVHVCVCLCRCEHVWVLPCLYLELKW